MIKFLYSVLLISLAFLSVVQTTGSAEVVVEPPAPRTWDGLVLCQTTGECCTYGHVFVWKETIRDPHIQLAWKSVSRFLDIKSRLNKSLGERLLDGHTFNECGYWRTTLSCHSTRSALFAVKREFDAWVKAEKPEIHPEIIVLPLEEMRRHPCCLDHRPMGQCQKDNLPTEK